MKRGDLYRVRRAPDEAKRFRIFVVVSRDTLVRSKFSSVICAPVYSQRHGLESEVDVGPDEGLKHASAIACDNLMSLPKTLLTDYVGMLSPAKLSELKTALRVALAVEG